LNATFGSDIILPSTTYYVSGRSHVGWAFLTSRALGADTWGNIGPIISCTTGKQGAPTVKTGNQAKTNGTFTFESWRISEYSSEVDYVEQHDGADIGGSVFLTTALAQFEYVAGSLALHDSWTGGSVSNSVNTAFCIDALKPDKPGTVTTRGSKLFSDYQSCNNQADKSQPVCSCALAVDRQWARLPLTACHKKLTKTPCTGSANETCVCKCSAEAAALSNQYIGMEPVFAIDSADEDPIGYWYSYPIAAVCHEKETLGSVRPDGSKCTWKRRPLARVIHGWQLFPAGMNATGLRGDPAAGLGPEAAPLGSQIKQNMAVYRSILKDAKLQSWSCTP
jgi:hypothetical protein